MASKFDKYLDKLPKENREKLANIKAQEVEQSSTPTANRAAKVDASKSKLNENTAETIRNVNNAEGNNYLNKKDSLSKYPTSKNTKPEQGGKGKDGKDNEPER